MSRVVAVASGVVLALQIFRFICCILEIVKISLSFSFHLAVSVTSASLVGLISILAPSLYVTAEAAGLFVVAIQPINS